MNFLITDDEVSVINSDDIRLGQKVPLGFWKLDFQKFKGVFLRKSEFKLSHGKIYGNSQDVANHIVTAFEKNSKSKNLGVLLSGGRGLGKTLTTRLVVEQLSKKYPIVIVSDYIPGMIDFMENLKDCVIIMDEFEKFMSGNVSGSDGDELTKQEAILSLLDGNTGSEGNLFLLTVNNVYRLDENLKSRPGRIRYHYRYVSETADVVEAYCQDNLKDKSIIAEVVESLSVAEYVSMDIISAFVEELNNFPGLKPKEVLNYFNIESKRTSYKFTIVIRDKSTDTTYTFERVSNYLNWDGLKLINRESRKHFEIWENNRDYEYYNNLIATIPEEAIPSLVYGKVELDPAECEIHRISTNRSEDRDFCDIPELELIGIYAEDPNSKFGKMKYMGTKDTGSFVDC